MCAKSIMADLPAFMDETFPNWKPLDTERMLYERIGNDSVFFKGFIDAIIECDAKRGGRAVWIIDWKTAGWGWSIEKKNDAIKQMQLRLYKHFWSSATDHPLSEIRCGFVLLKHGVKRKHCELVPVSFGDVTHKRTLTVVSTMLGAVRKGMAIKNRNSCKFCAYHGTSYCP